MEFIMIKLISRVAMEFIVHSPKTKRPKSKCEQNQTLNSPFWSLLASGTGR